MNEQQNIEALQPIAGMRRGRQKFIANGDHVVVLGEESFT